jgi:hypothetical protein
MVRKKFCAMGCGVKGGLTEAKKCGTAGAAARKRAWRVRGSTAVGPSSRPAIPAIPAKSVDNSCGGVLTFTGEFGMLCDSCDKCARG